ncbi:hypothetical protein PROFUN_03884 [Planoprotostelium fungivorum]|uniref:Uncharacterized protein n=1 Tax=Planoprotostelium fungivorum TaxID=1890364 RepID=A0A2P6MTL2_9EUKA|nr:hypothetical protein PROFUN_03884 [Planoprotostelium fungivorum]
MGSTNSPPQMDPEAPHHMGKKLPCTQYRCLPTGLQSSILSGILQYKNHMLLNLDFGVEISGCCAQHLTSLTNWKTRRNLREISATTKHIQCTFIEKELLGFLWFYEQRLIELFGYYVVTIHHTELGVLFRI